MVKVLFYKGGKFNLVLQNDSSMDGPAGDGLGKRTITIESPMQPDVSGPRLRKATAMGLPRVATFERVLNNALGRGRRDGSPSSRRSIQTQMTLPYFSFQPTIGRNSVRLHFSSLM